MINAHLIGADRLTASIQASSTTLQSSMNDVQTIESGDYNKLTNKPKIGGVTVEGEKELEDYGLEVVSSDFIESLFKKRSNDV